MMDPLSLTHYMTIISTADEGKKLAAISEKDVGLSFFLPLFLGAVQPSLAK